MACTGVHGANRLASNSLLEGLVFGARAGSRDAGRPPQAGSLAGPVRDAAEPPASTAPRRPPSERLRTEADVRRLMWDAVGLLRDREPLVQAVALLAACEAAVADQPAGSAHADERRLASLVTVGHLIARAALRRTESRGGHFRADFPARDDVHWTAHIVERSRN